MKKDVCRGMRVACGDVMWATRRMEMTGGVAQMVERSLSMREVRGSIPLSSTLFFSQSNPSFLFENCFGLHIGFPFMHNDSGGDLFSFSFLSR